MDKARVISYPYLPTGRSIEYVSAENEFMLAAKGVAQSKSLDSSVPTGSAVVKDGAVIGLGANGSDYHKTHKCRRVELGIPTGQGYELCEGCSPKNHSEPRAIADAQTSGHDTAGADLFLWGHWWCCEPCWNAMIAGGINHIYLQEGSEVTFNKARAAAPSTPGPSAA